MQLTNSLVPYQPARCKPPTPFMEELLMDIHERELLNLEPYYAGTTKFAKGLIERGLLQCIIYNTPTGKKVLVLSISDIGRSYLKKFK